MIPFIIAAIPIEVEPINLLIGLMLIEQHKYLLKKLIHGGGISMDVKEPNGMVQNPVQI